MTVAGEIHSLAWMPPSSQIRHLFLPGTPNYAERNTNPWSNLQRYTNMADFHDNGHVKQAEEGRGSSWPTSRFKAGFVLWMFITWQVIDMSHSRSMKAERRFKYVIAICSDAVASIWCVCQGK